MNWIVIDSKLITENGETLQDYLNDMTDSGWTLEFVDNGTLYLKRRK